MDSDLAQRRSAALMASVAARHRPRGPGFLLVRDADGLRHVIRASSIQMMSDADPCCDTTVAVISGRNLIIPQPLDELLDMIEGVW
jgi:hypothetical protein